MYLLRSSQFAVLLWKNFTLKRRHLSSLILEVSAALVFPVMLLVVHAFDKVETLGPYKFTPQPTSTWLSFLNNAEEWKLIYVPSNINVLKDIIEDVKRSVNISVKVQGLSSEAELENYIKYNYGSQNVLAVVVFDCDFKNHNDPLPLQVKYYLRFARMQRTIDWPDKDGWKTSLLFPVRPSAGPRNPFLHDGGSPGYLREGFLAIQHALDKAIMLYHKKNAYQKFADMNIFIQRFPHPVHTTNSITRIVTTFLPFLFIIMFSPTLLSIIRSIVREREKRQKEYQLIVGLKNWMIWTAHFFTFFFFYIIIISLICIIFFVKIVDKPIFFYSDYSLVFVFLTCYAVSSIFFGFMVSTFFNKVHMAASVGSVLYFVSFFPFTSISRNYGKISYTKKMAVCLNSNVALALGINLLIKLETKEIGVKWTNFWTQASLDDDLTFGSLTEMLLMDALIYGLVTWYIDAVFPGKYGIPQPWYFFLLRSYWFTEIEVKGRQRKRFRLRPRGTHFESEPTNLVAGIEMDHLHKEFGDSVALNNLTLNLYKGQITILLGQNGAGKTTTMSILTGTYLPTKGMAFVNGYDISKNINEIRKNLGFCPQHDFLFNELTLSEHIFFYTVIKGLHHKLHMLKTRQVQSADIDHMLSAFNLLEKRNAFSKSLSAGTKRKLSIIIALIGTSKVLLLDEPSSRMDPVSRRITWDLLQHYKTNRTILLSTHYMDEADILGDRIAIMVKGTLQCCGSSVFLKKLYGVGYHIIMEKKVYCDVGKISALIQFHIPDATLENNIGAELSFILPKEYSHRFEALFEDLENKQKALGIISYGISITTMEEVFFKVIMLADSQVDFQTVQYTPLKDQKGNKDMNKNLYTSLNQKTTKDIDMTMNMNYEIKKFSKLNEIATIKFNTGFLLYRQQFYSMFIKRALFSWRNRMLMLLQVSVILGVTTYSLINVNSNYDLPSREMDVSQYGRTIVPYSITGHSKWTLHLIKNLKTFLKRKNQVLRKVKAISLAVLDNILFMTLSGPSASIQVFNKPQPQPIYDTKLAYANGLQVSLCLTFGMAILVSSFCLQTVSEKTNKAKHIQFVSGVYIWIYWLSALLWDLIYFSIPCCLLLVVFGFCRMDAFIADYRFVDTMIIFILYGWCVVPFMYLASLLFSSTTAAYIKLVSFNSFTTVFSVFFHSTLHQYAFLFYEKELSISHLLMMLPNYNFAMSIGKLFNDYELKTHCAKKILNCSKSFVEGSVYTFEEHGIAKFLIALFTTGLFYLLLLMCLESTLWNLKNFVFHKIISKVYSMLKKSKKTIWPRNRVSRNVPKGNFDEDVENERRRVLALLSKLKKPPLLVKELKKVYFKCPIVMAVRDISLVVKKSECFGLLGFNGAGKTTIFKMLTGDYPTTSGVVLIDGINITKNFAKVRSRIGYCPEIDHILMNHMTGQESLMMYARLRGVPEPHLYKYVNTFLYMLHLESHANKFVSRYSAGFKRRLTAAIALMGNSSVIFLDEPSAGLDPVARRWLWNLITWMCQNGKAIVITSHSMEDCEALCTRLAIMVQGKFKCLGSPQQLKNKFGNIYNLIVKIKYGDDDNMLTELKKFIATAFPGSVLKQEHQGIFHYYIPRKEVHLGKVFNILEEAKVQFNLEDYSISQVTLEQIYLTFANIETKKYHQEIKGL
ncbi:phospholipid-transporting ATPase ABCA3-like isoform X2 [Erinaceus europaeus]|uniref:Phospholipid-transporting ATPase ABCA3-like isoform X2 n=1 Tax=Erinaceus europaeus TaxID=9365 RepID=A0ABM3VWX4_ERIEU|nr:phospholipid-transporting ATPase ABCA3-like isoform X2 [Erinaceus europaeus]